MTTSVIKPVDTTTTASTRPVKPERNWAYRLGTLALIALMIGLWEVLPAAGIVNRIILPPFSAVMESLWTLLTSAFFYRHLYVTMAEIMLGFIAGTLIGLFCGIALSVWPPVKRLTYPLVVAFQAIPKIVFAPLFISWLGYGMSSKVAMAIAIAFFPVLINTLVGLDSVPQDAVKLMRSLRATRMQIFRKVSFPHALPLIFAGVKAALTFAVIGAIVGEFVGASEGLGYLLDAYNFQLRIDGVFAIIVVLAVVGSGLYFLIEWLDKKLIFWRDEQAR